MADWGKILHRGNVEDRRASPLSGMGKLSLTGVALIAVVTLLSGGSAGDVLINVLKNVPLNVNETADTSQFAGEDTYEVFASTVLGSNNEMWRDKLQSQGMSYTEPRLVLFREATQSGCGYATSAVGPHYCPIDQTIYLDETFFDELTARFGARGGDVAEAYVIAHEVGHHIQNLGGNLHTVDELPESNERSISIELQADCYAGLWASRLKDRGIFEPGEIQEAMDAAASVGDDRIQESVTGQVNPETWTHGSAAQREFWFNKGYESDSIESCNTFN